MAEFCRDKFRLPMVTLRLPFMRIYVINSTSLITLAQRQFKVLSFTPVESKAVINVTGASKRAAEILQLERDDVGPHGNATRLSQPDELH